MAVFNLNKTGLWTMLVLQLLCFSLYPACGRPRFQDEDENAAMDEDHEQDEDLVEDQDEDESDKEETEEDGPSSTQAPGKCKEGDKTCQNPPQRPGGGGSGTAVGSGAEGGGAYETVAVATQTKDELLDE